VCHSGVVFANALMHCGTTSDTFLRENMDWLKKATNWAKFSATAALGMCGPALPLSTHRSTLTGPRAAVEYSQEYLDVPRPAAEYS
jgi:hypothetical protein